MIRLDCRDGRHDACETCSCTCHPLTKRTTMELDTDRINASAKLLDLAKEFLDEARRWRSPDVRIKLGRAARQLAEIGRQTLTRTPLEQAEAYHDAGRLALGQLQGARMFIQATTADQQ